MKKAVVSFSGGMDSTVLAYLLRQQGYEEIHLVGFNYGQRHVRELQAAQEVAEHLQGLIEKVEFRVVDLSDLKNLLKGSSQTDDSVEVPEGHYAEETMKATVVPNRNAIMLSIAYGYAISIGADRVCTAVHGGDHFIYPDCRPAFISRFGQALKHGNEGFGSEGLMLYTPFLDKSKADVCRLGATVDAPLDLTWSCYKGGEDHCGKCGTCVERIEAFKLAEVPDLTIYESELDAAEQKFWATGDPTIPEDDANVPD